MSPSQGQPPHDEAEDLKLIDFDELRNWVRFTIQSVPRRRRLAAVSLAVGLLATGLAWGALPRTYHVDAQVLAQRNTLMPALGNPNRRVPVESDAPTRAAAEAVLRRDNLVSLVKQTDLLTHWRQSRSSLQRAKDHVVALLAGPPSDEDQISAIIGLMERRLTVTVSEATITISLDWPDPQLAYRLVDTALQNFLDQRHAVEVSTIAETISILEGHANTLRESIDAAMEDLKRARDPASARAAATTPGTPAAPAPRRDPAQEALRAEAAETRLMLEAKRRAITELEEFRRRRLAELQTELEQQRTVYAEAHPNIVKLQQSIAALQEDSPQLLLLRKDENDLVAEASKLAGARFETGPVSARPADPRAASRRGDSEELGSEYARTRLRFAMEKYDALLERIDSARIELDTARANFKYRYNVIRPPMFPKRPVKPTLPVVLGGGLLASMLLAFAATSIADVRSGRMLESWQVKKFLQLPVLGNVPGPFRSATADPGGALRTAAGGSPPPA